MLLSSLSNNVYYDTCNMKAKINVKPWRTCSNNTENVKPWGTCSNNTAELTPGFPRIHFELYAMLPLAGKVSNFGQLSVHMSTSVLLCAQTTTGSPPPPGLEHCHRWQRRCLRPIWVRVRGRRSEPISLYTFNEVAQTHVHLSNWLSITCLEAG